MHSRFSFGLVQVTGRPQNPWQNAPGGFGQGGSGAGQGRAEAGEGKRGSPPAEERAALKRQNKSAASDRIGRRIAAETQSAGDIYIITTRVLSE